MDSYVKVIKLFNDFRKDLLDKVDNGKRLDEEKLKLLDQVDDDIWERYQKLERDIEEEIELDKKILYDINKK